MRFVPSDKLASMLFDLQVEAMERGECKPEDQYQVLPGVRKYFGGKENIDITLQLLQDTIAERVYVATSTYARAQLKESLTPVVWEYGSFTEDVRIRLARLLALDPESPAFIACMNELGDEFDKWSAGEHTGLKDVRLHRENGQVISTIGQKVEGTKQSHNDKKEKKD